MTRTEALEALGITDPTHEQDAAIDALLATLTPPMDEPGWPGAVVKGRCGWRAALHVRRAFGNPPYLWECDQDVHAWSEIINPRPLTPAEYAEHGIPLPAPVIIDELIETFRDAWSPRGIRAGLLAIGLPEARQ